MTPLDGILVQSANTTALTSPAAPVTSTTNAISTPISGYSTLPFAFTNEGYSDPFSITFRIDSTGAPVGALNMYLGLSQKTTTMYSANSTNALPANSLYGLSAQMATPSLLTSPTGVWLNDFVPSFDYMFSIGRAQNGWNVTSMIENGGTYAATPTNYKETIFTTDTGIPFISPLYIGGSSTLTYLNITYTGSAIVYSVNNVKWRSVPAQITAPLYGAIMLGILPSSVKVYLTSFVRVGQQSTGPVGITGPSIISIRPISSPTYNSSANLSVNGNTVVYRAGTNVPASDQDSGGEWAFITTPITSASTVNFTINFPAGFTSSTYKHIEVGLRRIRNTTGGVGGSPGSDITQEVPTMGTPDYTDTNIDYSIYIVNSNFMLRAAPLATTTSTVLPPSTIFNNTASPYYGRLSVLPMGSTGSATYTIANAPEMSTGVNLIGTVTSVNNTAWYSSTTAPANTSVNVSIVFSGNTISYFINGVQIMTRMGASVPFLSSSAPYYPAVRMLFTEPGDAVTMSLAPAQGPTGTFTATNLSLVSKAPINVLSLNNANTVSVIKPGTVNLNGVDLPYVFSNNPLTGPFVLNFMFNTDTGASTDGAADGQAASGASSAIEFAVGLVSSIAARNAFDANTNPMLYGMMVNTSTVGTPASVYWKGNGAGPFLTTNPVINAVTPSPVNNAQMLSTATQTIPFGGNQSLQIKYDGTNLSFYVNGVLISPATTTAGQNYTFTPATRGPYYLVMSFANGDQYSTIPLGQRGPPTNFNLQVTLSEIFGGTNILGTTLTHLQTFTPIAGGAQSSAPSAVNTPILLYTKDAANSSAATPEIVYAAGVFTYNANDSASRTMVNLTPSLTSTVGNSGFFLRYVVFTGLPSATAKITGPWIQATGVTNAWSLNSKFSFILNNGDSFILQGYGNSLSATTVFGGSLIVEKLPVAQGGRRRVPVSPIRKLPKYNSLKLRKSGKSKVYTKKGTKR